MTHQRLGGGGVIVVQSAIADKHIAIVCLQILPGGFLLGLSFHIPHFQSCSFMHRHMQTHNKRKN